MSCLASGRGNSLHERVKNAREANARRLPAMSEGRDRRCWDVKIFTTVTNPGTAASFARSAKACGNGWGTGMASAELPILARLRDRIDGTPVTAAKPAYVPTHKQTRLHVPPAPPELRP